MAVTPVVVNAPAYSYNWVNFGWNWSGDDDDYCDSVRVYRNGVLVSETGGVLRIYNDYSVLDGTGYSYIVTWHHVTDGWSGDSNTVSVTTPMYAPSGFGGSAAPTSCSLSWTNNSASQTGIEIYRDGVLITTTGAAATSYDDTGLTPAVTYSYEIRAVNGTTASATVGPLELFTADPPNAPSLLTMTPLSTTKIRLNWQDNSSNETGFKVYGKASGGVYALVATLGAGVQTYEWTGLTSNTVYYAKVLAYNTSGNSAYSNEVYASTFAAIATPTGLTVTAFGDQTLEILFQDNSELEDDHRLERSDDGSTGWAEIVTLPPNCNFYRDTTLGDGAQKWYRVRAKQGASYSDYSTIVDGTTISPPAAPTALAVSEYQDVWARLTWTKTTGEAGYEIWESTDNGANYTQVATVKAGVEYYKRRGLTASTHYHWKILAYNAAGDSAYTSDVSETTRASYSPSKFELLCYTPEPNIYYLIEINPFMELSGWSLTATKTYTYEYAITDSGINIDAVYENGVAYTVKVSIAEVEATASTFYCDYYNRKVYIHTSTGGSPIDFTIMGSFWLYFTTDQRGLTEFNQHNYHPLVPPDGVPDVSAEIKPYWEGSFSLNVGTVQLINAKREDGSFWFDKIFQRYTWQNRKVKILAGGEGFAYTDFYNWAAGHITDDFSLADTRFTLPLRDIRSSLGEMNLHTTYLASDFPLATDIEGKIRPFVYGAVSNFVPVCIDATNRIFELHNGRIKSVAYVYLNGVALTGGTDYYINYQQGRIILSRTLTYESKDKVTADFTGQPDEADAAISNAALIWLDGAQRFGGLALADINLDTVYETAEGKTAACAIPIFKETDFSTFTRRLEASVLAFSFQDNQGRVGFKISPTTAPTSILYVPEQFLEDDFQMTGGKDSRYKHVDVGYSEDPGKDNSFSWVTSQINTFDYKYGVKGTKQFETCLTSSADATTLKASIIALLDRPEVLFSLKRRLYPGEIGDLFYLTRTRYFDSTGTASKKLMRLTMLAKSTGGKVSIKAEEV